VIELCENEEFLLVGTDQFQDVQGPDWSVIANWVIQSDELSKELNKTIERFDAARKVWSFQPMLRWMSSP
jgi:hypothetical protein